MPTFTYNAPGSRSPVTIELYRPLTSLGRSDENDICIPDPLIEEEHAHIKFDGQKFTITALNKKNPIQVNGRSRRQATLKHEDQITIGATTCIFRMFDSPKKQLPDKNPQENILDAYRELHLFSQDLMQNHKLSELLEKLVDRVINITNAQRGFIILLEGDKPTVAIGRNIQKETLADAEGLFSDSIVTKVATTLKPVIVSDALNHDDFKTSASVVNLQLSSVMCVPLLARGKLLGVLYLGNSRVTSLFDDKTLELLTIFSSQASLIIQNALLVNELTLDNQRLNEQIKSMQYNGIIGSCESISKIFEKVKKVATTDVSVLITGETGTGKELFSREIHRLSNRHKGPFVTINCAAIPENLLESELFGHVKGAFTGAIANKIGKFQAAHKGTLFLDEMGELPLNLQVKLLRALERKVITPVGSNKPIQVDIRIVAATNKNLEEEVQAGRFREDLYYRLNVISLHLPPLRERGDDLILLARFFLQKFAAEYNRNIKGFTRSAIIALRKYRWPGNIRELENRIRKAVILADGTHIDSQDLDIKENQFQKILPLAEAKEKFQAEYINEVLALNNGNRTKTAKDLGVDPRTIFRHLEKEQGRRP